MKKFSRRDFLKIAGKGTASIIIVGCGGGGGDSSSGGGPGAGGPGGPGGGGDGAIAETLNFTITDAVKEMVTHEPNNPAAGPAESYFWVFREDRFPADCPGPQIYAVAGDLIALNVTNALDGPHAFFIPGMVDTGPIAPGETVSVTFTVGAPGTYLYHDNLNEPVNRVMGLHGAFVVMPSVPSGQRFTPYDAPTAAVQQLFDDFGSTPWWPGLSWEAGDAANGTPPFRQHVWLAHQVSPVLFDEVGLFARNNPGQDYPAAQFIEAFCNDPFINTSNDPRSVTSADFPVKAQQTVTLPDGVTTMVAGVFNRKPHFFTINGQSGFFAHHNPAITPMYRVGEPCLVRILNAGLWSHCWHLHANHFYVTAIDNVPQEILLWIDVFNILPMRHVDYVIPFMRTPDVPNQRGIGRADPGLITIPAGHPTWPPREELERHMPNLLDIEATNFAGTGLVDMAVLQAPLCYPMHDHSEPTQTAQGGNYNCGQIAGIYFFGDRNTPGALNFEIDPGFEMMDSFGDHSGETGPPTGGWPPEDGQG